MEARLVLTLSIVEALIAAHRAAKLDGDHETIRLIEAALAYAGRRLAEAKNDNERARSGMADKN